MSYTIPGGLGYHSNWCDSEQRIPEPNLCTQAQAATTMLRSCRNLESNSLQHACYTFFSTQPEQHVRISNKVEDQLGFCSEDPGRIILGTKTAVIETSEVGTLTLYMYVVLILD